MEKKFYVAQFFGLTIMPVILVAFESLDDANRYAVLMNRTQNGDYRVLKAQN